MLKIVDSEGIFFISIPVKMLMIEDIKVLMFCRGTWLVIHEVTASQTLSQKGEPCPSHFVSKFDTVIFLLLFSNASVCQ